MLTFIICILFFVPFINGQTTATKNSPSPLNSCSSQCRMTDKDLSCWNKTLSFYEQILLVEMQNFIVTQANMINWYKTNHQLNQTDLDKLFGQIEQESIDALKKASDDIENNWNDDEDYDRDVLSKHTINATVHALIENVRNVTRNHPKAIESSCPVPCETEHILWIYLFIASAILNAILAIAVVPFVFLRAKRDHDNSSTAEPLIKAEAKT